MEMDELTRGSTAGAVGDDQPDLTPSSPREPLPGNLSESLSPTLSRDRPGIRKSEGREISSEGREGKGRHVRSFLRALNVVVTKIDPTQVWRRNDSVEATKRLRKGHDFHIVRLDFRRFLKGTGLVRR
jgi:hypothetical protein